MGLLKSPWADCGEGERERRGILGGKRGFLGFWREYLGIRGGLTLVLRCLSDWRGILVYGMSSGWLESGEKWGNGWGKRLREWRMGIKEAHTV